MLGGNISLGICSMNVCLFLSTNSAEGVPFHPLLTVIQNISSISSVVFLNFSRATISTSSSS